MSAADVAWSIGIGVALFLLGAAVTWAVYRFRTRAERRNRRELARQLDERFQAAFAAGQITPEHFNEIQRTLASFRRG